jgi:hypothetical protein
VKGLFSLKRTIFVCALSYARLISVYRGESRGGCTRRAPLPPKIGKNMIFWSKIVIFHTKYPQDFRASLRSTPIFFKCASPNLKSWIRPWSIYLNTRFLKREGGTYRNVKNVKKKSKRPFWYSACCFLSP